MNKEALIKVIKASELFKLVDMEGLLLDTYLNIEVSNLATAILELEEKDRHRCWTLPGVGLKEYLMRKRKQFPFFRVCS